MYLENPEPSKASGEGAVSAEAMVAEQCQVPALTEAADLTVPSKGGAEYGVKVLVDYTEQIVASRETDPSLLCVEHCSSNQDLTDAAESCAHRSGHSGSFEPYSAKDEFVEWDRTNAECENLRLSQPFGECAQHCECFKPCKSPEHCANHSLASDCSPCCKVCGEHFHLFQQCMTPDQQVESLDFGPCEMSDFIPECTDHFGLIRRKPCGLQDESFDSEPDTSTDGSEQCDLTGLTHSVSDSGDLSDCGAGSCEDEESHHEIECTDNTDDSCSTDGTQNDDKNNFEASDEESWRFLGNKTMPVKVNFEDSEHASFSSECCEKDMDTEENSAQMTKSDMSEGHDEMYGDPETDQDYEVAKQCALTEQCYSDENCDGEGCFSEEDGSSDCSSIETKSFKTCLEGSIPSDPCSDSSGESEKGAQEDSSDEQTQWESFEDDEDIEQSNINESSNDRKKTPTVDLVIEDYFELFDRADYYGHAFTQRQQHYISCFDGGDIHDRLYVEELQAEAQKPTKNVHSIQETHEEISTEDVSFDTPEEACEDGEEQPEEWKAELESSLAEDEFEDNESALTEAHGLPADANNEEPSDGQASKIFNEETEVCLSTGEVENMCAPCAEDISVEGDAYEDNISDIPAENISMTDNKHDIIADDKEEPNEERPDGFHSDEDRLFSTCSESESYWSLIDDEDEVCNPGVEEYYAYQIKSIQTSAKQTLNGFIMEERTYDQKLNGKAASWNDGEDTSLSLTGTEFQDVDNYKGCPEECTIIGLSDSFSAVKQKEESDDVCALNRISREMRVPEDVIHSVVSENAEIEASDPDVQVQSTKDPEEEDSDDEAIEPCECEYCIPPLEQVPVSPLLPQMKSNDAGKICVVIDLDETLVHSSFKPVNNADFIIPVEIDGTVHQVYVLKRPHVDEFLKRMGELFECVLFTASLSKYADPVSDILDKWGAFRSRLFREACVFHKGNYVKDLSRLGRDLNKVIIIDNSPASYIFHPSNAVPVASWFDDMSDSELLDLLPFFERLSQADDVYGVLQQQSATS